MPLHPRLAFADKNLRVAFQTVPGWQELRLSLRLTTAFPAEKVGRLGMVNIGTAVTWGTVGGAELPPWESEWQVTSPFDVPATQDGMLFEHVARIKGMSHRYIPHLVRHMGMVDRGLGDVVEMSVIGSAAITGPLSITEAEVVPWMLDPTQYPGRWAEPGFPLDFVKGKKRSFGVEIELVNDVTPQQKLALELRLGGATLLLASYLDEKGNEAKHGLHQFAVEGNKAGTYMANLAHAHAASRDAVANMLMKIHVQIAPIARATIISRAA